MNRFGNHFGLGHRSWIDRTTSPRNIDGHSREIDNASISAVAAQVMRCAHEDAVHRAGLNTQRTKHAFTIVNREGRDLKALSSLDFFLANINAIDWTSLRALITSNACRQVKSVKTAIPGRDRHGKFWIFEFFSEGASILAIRDQPVSHRHRQPLANGRDRRPDIIKPLEHERPFLSKVQQTKCGIDNHERVTRPQTSEL